MAEPAWLSYAGLVSGVAGTIAACLAWVRTGRIKSLDLRVELAKAEVEIQAVVNDLPGFLEHARKSRESVSAATGQSGALKGWLVEWTTDYEAVNSFSAWLPPSHPKRTHLSHEQLETRLISAARLQTQAKLMKEKYVVSLAADDKERENIRADHRSATHARLQGYQ